MQNFGGTKHVCGDCGVAVSDGGRHRRRGRCAKQHRHPSPKKVDGRKETQLKQGRIVNMKESKENAERDNNE